MSKSINAKYEINIDFQKQNTISFKWNNTDSKFLHRLFLVFTPVRRIYQIISRRISCNVPSSPNDIVSTKYVIALIRWSKPFLIRVLFNTKQVRLIRESIVLFVLNHFIEVDNSFGFLYFSYQQQEILRNFRPVQAHSSSKRFVIQVVSIIIFSVEEIVCN